MKTLLDLQTRLRKLEGELKERSNKAAKEAAFVMIEELVRVTPVDTSQAISNWKMSIQIEDFTKIQPHFLGSRGSTQLESAQESIYKATVTLAKKKPGEVLFLQNNAEYITDLNMGSSPQHPGGFFELAFQKGRKTAKLELERKRNGR